MKIGSRSFDKGYRHPYNMALLEMVVPDVIMPKKGKCNREESALEHEKGFQKLRHKHSAVESNIHSLETRGLFRHVIPGVITAINKTIKKNLQPVG
ncbi:MAG: hypothetical protein LBG96_01680 [Tannerella sp.]|jgi:hypothetical protein|nr:hypothetical protein [Tannerella sp.]